MNGKYEEELGWLGTTPIVTGDDVEEDIPAFILRDSAYRNSHHFVMTYKVTECADASICHLNFRLSKARYCVEHVFGILKGRFQIFEKPLRCAVEDFPFCVQLIASICVIHNFLIDWRDIVREKDIFTPPVTALNSEEPGTISNEDDDDDDDDIPEGEQNNLWDTTQEAFLRRMRWCDEERAAAVAR